MKETSQSSALAVEVGKNYRDIHGQTYYLAGVTRYYPGILYSRCGFWFRAADGKHVTIALTHAEGQKPECVTVNSFRDLVAEAAHE